MSEVEQKTDGDSVDLTTTVQLSPHSPTDVVSSDKKDGELVSLDEVYEVTGQEKLSILAANCKEFLKSGRLHPSAFTSLDIQGSETMIPMYDKMNARKGGESFLETLKKTFIAIVTAAKKFLLMAVEWIITKVKVLLGFEKTERELAIVAANSDDVKRDVLALLATLVGGDKMNLDVEEFYEALPGNVTQQEAFSIVQNRNKTALEQIESMTSIQSKLTEVDETIKRSAGYARNARSRYQQAVNKLRQAWATPETFSTADIIEFRSALDQDIGVNINPEPIRDQLSAILDEAYGIELGKIGADKAFKQAMATNKEAIEKSITVKVDPADFKKIKASASVMSRILLTTSKPFDAGDIGSLKSIIEVEDAKLIETIDAAFDKAGILKMSYASYCAIINEFSWSLNQLITVSGNIRRSIANVINWSNKVDKLMLTYISRNLRSILEVEKGLLTEKGREVANVVDENGEVVGSNMTLNYDDMFLSKHPYYGTALATYRMKTGELRKQYKSIDKINNGLKALGLSVRI
jgi:hypothetical protein